MDSVFPNHRFGDLLSEPLRNGIYKKKEFHGRGAKIVNMGELFGNSRMFNVPMKRVELEDKEIPKVLLSEGDLLFARRSLTAEGAGKCSIVKEIVEQTTFESSIIRARPRQDEVDSDFLYYLFDSHIGKYLLGTIKRQVAVAGITGGDLKELELPIPGLEEQKAIAHILGSLDDKIELNRQMNQTLEAMAQALFKSWFVDFDPVIDNALAAGHDIPDALQARAQTRQAAREQAPASLPAEIQQLFPSEFEFSEEMGWVPKGWLIKPLSQVARLQNAAAKPNAHPEKIWEHYSIPAFDEGGMPALELGDAIKSGKYFVPDGCVLASKLNPETPRIWMPNIRDAESAICSTEFMPFVPVELSNRPYLYSLLKSEPMQTAICNRATGSTGSRQRVKPKDIEAMPILSAPEALLMAFSNSTAAIVEKAGKQFSDNLFVAKLRDTLLPKLISGELRIPDAEKLVTEAGL